jgi:hypothetical protein
MAITKFERWKTSEKNSDDLAKEADGIFEKPIYEEESPAIQLIHDKVHELTDLINEHITKMAVNDAKTGITTAQANAITANTAKTGITSQQATTITDNKDEAKRLGGLVTTNTSDISNNATEMVKLTRGKLSVSTLPIAPAGVEQAVECGVVYDSKTKTHSMMFAYSETTTPKGGKPVTVTKTGSIQLK